LKVVQSEKFDIPEVDDSKFESKNFGKKECIALNLEQEKELLLTAYSKNYKHGLMLEVALNSGLRVNELVNLIIPDLNLSENPTIRIQDRKVSKYSDSFTAKTDLSNRTIPITVELSEKIKGFIANRKTGYVFQSKIKKDRDFDKITKTSMIRQINKYAQNCPSIAKNVGFHTTRRTYASKLLDKGVPLSQIMLLLGHSSIDTTLKYLKSVRKINGNLVRKALESGDEE
jgi:integrase